MSRRLSKERRIDLMVAWPEDDVDEQDVVLDSLLDDAAALDTALELLKAIDDSAITILADDLSSKLTEFLVSQKERT